MKICIIGPSGSGKSTLALKLSKITHIPDYGLDSIIFEFTDSGRRISLNPDQYIKKLVPILSKESWIIEGLQPVEQIFNEADIIIWLKVPFFTAIFRQWKRFVTSREQRQKYGFANNLRLSLYIYWQYFCEPTPETDPKKTWLRSVGPILMTYNNKLVTIKDESEGREFLHCIQKNIESPQLISSVYQLSVDRI